jgi:hypothetical protein
MANYLENMDLLLLEIKSLRHLLVEEDMVKRLYPLLSLLLAFLLPLAQAAVVEVEVEATQV